MITCHECIPAYARYVYVFIPGSRRILTICEFEVYTEGDYQCISHFPAWPILQPSHPQPQHHHTPPTSITPSDTIEDNLVLVYIMA